MLWYKIFCARGRGRSADDSATTGSDSAAPGGAERRQFADSHADLPPDAREFAEAVDRYKIEHGRKFITLAELFEVMKKLGYHR